MMIQYPLHSGYLADPFFFEAGGEYFIVGTGGGDCDPAPAPVFPLLHSKDFKSWKPAGFALPRLGSGFGNTYWAPSVAEHKGEFYLYYSVGFEDRMHHLRVAKSKNPLGPYEDSGLHLTDPFTLPFAIDSHPFRDKDGRWYLYYARDFLEADNGMRVGTGIVVDELENMTMLKGNPTLVVRPKYDWQRFLDNRPMYGRLTDWHTLEGPCVIERKGTYYCLFSGGRWENETYGVDYATAPTPRGPWTDHSKATGARVLHSTPELLGPGHNTVGQGPDDKTYICFHAWNSALTSRQPRLTELVITENGLKCPEFKE